MRAPPLLDLARDLGLLSLVSVGGANVLLPELHRSVVAQRHWLDEASFNQLFALAQAAPGPNILFASLIGWKIAGLSGLAVATAAILLPSSALAFALGRGLRRWGDAPWIKLAAAGTVPVALGLILASGAIASMNADHGALGYLISALAAALMVFTKRNPLIAIALGAAMGLLAPHLGLVL
jgi:chromate transporter